MKKKTLILTIVTVLVVSLFAGCDKSDDAGNDKDNLNFENKKETVFVNKDVYTDHEAQPALEVAYLNPDVSLEEALKQNEELKKALEQNEEPDQDLYIFDTENIIFDGKDIKCRRYVENDSEIPMTQTIFMEANNNLQPFKIDGGEEREYYAFTLNPGESKEVYITFSPIYAPSDEKAATLLYTITNVALTKELENIMIQNPTSFNAAYEFFVHSSVQEFGIKADSKENERIVESKKNEMGKDSPYAFKDESGKKIVDSSAGLTLGDAFEKETFDGAISLKVEWNGTTPLYARNLCYAKNDIRVFLIIDGELVPAFNGEYFADYYQNKGVMHNIELDNAALPKDGNHLAYGVMMYKNSDTGMMGDIEIDYSTLLMLK